MKWSFLPLMPPSSFTFRKYPSAFAASPSRPLKWQRPRARLPSDAAARARWRPSAQEATVARVRPRASLGNHRTIMKVATSNERLHMKAFESASKYDAFVELPARAQKNTSPIQATPKATEQRI